MFNSGLAGVGICWLYIRKVTPPSLISLSLFLKPCSIVLPPPNRTERPPSWRLRKRTGTPPAERPLPEDRPLSHAMPHLSVLFGAVFGASLDQRAPPMCPSGCNGHGFCDDATCVCYPG